MGFRQTGPHRASKADSSDTTTRVTDTTRQRQSDTDTTKRIPDSDHPSITASQADQQYDVDISSRRQLNELQRLEQTHGSKVHDWVDEGMPREAMGTPSDMHAFRKRKDTSVPWNVEAHNAQSVQRSTEAAADTTRPGEAGVPDSVRDVISSTGHSLDGSIQRTMEDKMGESFDDVQVHTGPLAANACESINARAFTVGNHVAFNHGEYDPGSPAGQHVIAHELAHVRQQTGGAVSMLPQEGLDLEIDPDPVLEREAEQTAQRVLAGEEIGLQRLGETDIHVQRLLGVGDSKVSTRYNSLLNSRQEVEERTRRLRGQATIDGKKLPGAVQQQLPNCYIATLQAGLCALGWNTQNLQDYVDPSDILKMLTKHFKSNTSSNDFLDFCTTVNKGIDDDNRSASGMSDYLPSLRNSSVNKNILKNRQIKKYYDREFSPDVKSAVLINLLSEMLSQVPTKQANEMGHELSQFGESVVQKLIERPQRPETDMFFIEQHDSMRKLKLRFMQVLKKRKTPLAVSIRAHNKPNWLNTKRIVQHEPHSILVYGVHKDDKGTVWVAIRDGNQPDNETKEIKLNRFLLPLHTPTIKSQLPRKDRTGNYYRFSGFDMSTETKNTLASRTSSSQ